MNNVRAFACKSLLIIAWGLSRSDLYARVQQQEAGSRMPGVIAAKDAKALEDLVAANPDNLPAREQLINYYFIASLTTKTAEIQEKREQHVFWLIEHTQNPNLPARRKQASCPPMLLEALRDTSMVNNCGLRKLKKILAINEFFATLRSTWHYSTERSLGNSFKKPWNSIQAMGRRRPDWLSHTSTNACLRILRKRKRLSRKKPFRPENAGSKVQIQRTGFTSWSPLQHLRWKQGRLRRPSNTRPNSFRTPKNSMATGTTGMPCTRGISFWGGLRCSRATSRKLRNICSRLETHPALRNSTRLGPIWSSRRNCLKRASVTSLCLICSPARKFWKMGGDQLQSWITTVKKGGIPDLGGNLFY